MFSEDDKIFNFNNVRVLLSIFFFDMSKNLDFNKSLLVKFSFISDNFKCQKLFFFVIKDFNDFTITSFTHFLQYLISVGNMIVGFINILISWLWKNYSALSKYKFSDFYLFRLFFDFSCNNLFYLFFFETLCPT